jgi:hypothetical protein
MPGPPLVNDHLSWGRPYCHIVFGPLGGPPTSHPLVSSPSWRTMLSVSEREGGTSGSFSSSLVDVCVVFLGKSPEEGVRRTVREDRGP